ncbi:calcium/calmodulin-dependent 3',5'-cyclic nucleotide phosphodiesterase 1A-like isoform X1 [Lates japonicus]|uniref:Calcium/calmodulin-dependent 3',5'-cyclic nucleotide phosphodiesterase 1A-like isoform X1 n=1 Tax=Lates japonicus TaxID=270547 RepID=A0AAD3R0D0_LATJO|nr:calcium/calmodulin-dependent 3',5'-cyclic nucleotide phosphodiesterase 1A-like isoform X1 [Lates japonicus]
MGSVTSALTRTRNALVKVGSQPENHDPERSQSAPESDRTRKKNTRFNVSIQTGRQSSRQSLSEVLSRQDSDVAKQTSRKKTSEGPQSVANEDGESSTRPHASFARSKSQSALWNAITAGMGIKGKEQKAPLNDPRSPEEILADDLPAADEPDATEKTAIRRLSPPWQPTVLEGDPSFGCSHMFTDPH